MDCLEQPILLKKEFFFAWQEWLKGSSMPTIAELINQHTNFENVSSQTLEQWKVLFDNTSMLDQEEDKVFRWDKLEQYKIPWKDSGFLLKISQAYENPSGRLIKWIWRLSQIKDIREWDIEILLGLAEKYTNHERELMFRQPVTDTIEGLNSEVSREALGDRSP